MTFTYSVPFQSDRDRVRFHIGDVDALHSKFTDEELDAVLIQSGNNWQQAVLMALGSLILRLAVPDFRADWLQVSVSAARKAYQQMLMAKRGEFGISAVSGGYKRVTRGE